MNRKRPYVSFPPSFSQRRLCFLEAADGTGMTFCLHRCFRVIGHLDLGYLKRTLEILIARHEPLRTVFVVDDTAIDGLEQRIYQQYAVPLEVYDLSLVEDREAVATDEIQSAIQKHLSIEYGPLWRVAVWILGSQEYLLLFSLHELVADGWSEGIFLRDLSDVYSLMSGESEVELPSLTIQYADWASWQRKRFTEDLRLMILQWWKKKLEGVNPLIQLPFLTVRTSDHPVGGRIERLLPESTMRTLNHSAAQQRVTLYILLMSVYGLALASYTGQNDLLIGTPELNRERSETQNSLGFFLNTLAIRIRVNEDSEFEKLVQHVRSTIHEAFAHRDIPFDSLVASINPPRHERLTPLIQVCFTYRTHAQRGTLNLATCEAEEIALGCNTSRFALTVGVDERRHGGTIWALFDKALLAERTVEELLTHYHRLLSRVMEQSGSRISALLASDGASVSGEILASQQSTNTPTVDLIQSEQHVIPSTLVDELSTAMGELLGVDQVGQHDNFFTLGGHSLLAYQFLSRVNRLLKIEVPLRQWLPNPTIANLINMRHEMDGRPLIGTS